jgi:hypothetical protein
MAEALVAINEGMVRAQGKPQRRSFSRGLADSAESTAPEKL